MTGIELIEDRYIDQANKYNWEHDDTHVDGELAVAAAFLTVSYVLLLHGYSVEEAIPTTLRGVSWPFEGKPDLKESKIENLAGAGALIAAEIARLQRLEKNG